MLDYAACCGYFHQSDVPAPTAEALMRSRYSAYVMKLMPYLLDSWHDSTRPASLDLSEPIKWLELDVIRQEQIDTTHVIVEFIARYKVQGRACRLHEVSHFVLENGRWFYVNGEHR